MARKSPPTSRRPPVSEAARPGKSVTHQPEAVEVPALFHAGTGTGILSATSVATLQRSVGNQATQRVINRAIAQRDARGSRAHGAPLIQRWPTDTPTLDWAQTRTMTPIMSGQAVLFVKDSTDPPVVIKAEDAAYGVTLLNSYVHKQAHGTGTITTRDATGEKQALIDLMENPGTGPVDKWDELGNAKESGSWIVPRSEPDEQGNARETRGTTPREKAHFFMGDQFRSKPKIQVMKVATGESTRKLAHAERNAVPDTMTAYRAAFSDPAYVKKLGELTAADMFLENSDRVTANFGNFMTAANNAIELIDNMNDSAQGLWKSPKLIGPTASLDKLAPSKIDALVKAFMFSVTNEVRFGIKDGDKQIKLWLAEAAGSGTRAEAIKAQYIEGVNAGRARLIKLYATDKTGKEGRQAKKAAKEAYKMDKRAGDTVGKVSYWQRLKARARYLKKLS
jgi:hypothetical protein